MATGVSSKGQDVRIFSQNPPIPGSSTPHRAVRFTVWVCTFFCFAPLLLLAGCRWIGPKPPAEYVYVVTKKTYLRDRIAPVAVKTATVVNGQKLQVLEHDRRFLRVKTDQGETGWTADLFVATQQVADEFARLQKDHQGDPVVGTAVLRNELYMHSKPGRDTDKFYLLPENTKVRLLVRASVPKVSSTGQPVYERPTQHIHGAVAPAGTPPVRMEDWWLVRDAEDHTGWMLAQQLDVDVPPALMRYTENKRIVAAYVLATVYDPVVDAPDKNIPEYVAVLREPKEGLPYDFDLARVFTWNVKKHRYETAYRDSNIEGYLPVTIGEVTTAKGAHLPTFSYKVAAEGSTLVTDPQTGISKASQLIEKTYQMDGVMVKRVLAPGQTTAPKEAHPEPVKERKTVPGVRYRRR
ncbi:MAG: SH3 domain-containing protein [Acidobacteriaceae bacterium]